MQLRSSYSQFLFYYNDHAIPVHKRKGFVQATTRDNMKNKTNKNLSQITYNFHRNCLGHMPCPLVFAQSAINWILQLFYPFTPFASQLFDLSAYR